MWFNTVKRFYDNQHPSYTDEGMRVFVKAAMITPDEYKTITGQAYIE